MSQSRLRPPQVARPDGSTVSVMELGGNRVHDTGWQTLTAFEMRKKLKQARDKYDEVPPRKEVRYREYEDPTTKELVIRVIPHTGVSPT